MDNEIKKLAQEIKNIKDNKKKESSRQTESLSKEIANYFVHKAKGRKYFY